MKLIERAIVGLNIFIMTASLAAMIILGAIQVILRNFFDCGLAWADVLIRGLVLWVGFSGAVVATSRGRHIAIGVLTKFIPDDFSRSVHVMVSMLTSIICLFLAYASVNFVASEAEGGGILFLGIPLWISEIIIPATFSFLTFQFFVHALTAPAPNGGQGL